MEYVRIVVSKIPHKYVYFVCEQQQSNGKLFLILFLVWWGKTHPIHNNSCLGARLVSQYKCTAKKCWTLVQMIIPQPSFPSCEHFFEICYSLVNRKKNGFLILILQFKVCIYLSFLCVWVPMALSYSTPHTYIHRTRALCVNSREKNRVNSKKKYLPASWMKVCIRTIYWYTLYICT